MRARKESSMTVRLFAGTIRELDLNPEPETVVPLIDGEDLEADL